MKKDSYYGGPLDGHRADAIQGEATIRLSPDTLAAYIRTPTLDTDESVAWVFKEGQAVPAMTYVQAIPSVGQKTLTLQELRNVVRAADAAGLPEDCELLCEVTFRGLLKKLTIRPKVED